MKNCSKFFIVTLFVCFNLSLSAVNHIQHIKDVAQHISEKRILVAFDIDNTVLRPATDLGSDQWFSHLVQEKQAAGVDITTAMQQVLPFYFHIHGIIELTTTEPTLPEDIKDLKKNCEHVMYLTARSVNLAERTVEQIKKNKLPVHVPVVEEYVPAVSSPSLYKDGILFCGMNDKGDVLLSFLDKLEEKPELIIFVDDKEKNLKAVEVAAKKRNIEFVGLRYAGCDELVAAFNKEVTEQELQEFLAQHPLN